MRMGYLLGILMMILLFSQPASLKAVAGQDKQLPEKARSDIAITNIRCFAWYQGDGDKVTYHEVTEYPVPVADVSEADIAYPMFDIVVTITNEGSEIAWGEDLKTTISYRVGSIAGVEAMDDAYERAMQRAKWRKPVWVRHSAVPLLGPGESYDLQIGCIEIDKVTYPYWKKHQWPFRARISAFVPRLSGEKNLDDNRRDKELAIDMLD
jgi:hypothetical protein